MIDEIFLKRGEIGFLLIHGLCKSPKELESVAKKLADYGFTVYCPRLPGHGTCPGEYETCFRELPKVTYEDWERSVDEAFLKLRQEVDKVYVGGVSLGANLSLLLASHRNVEGIILLGAVISTRGILPIGSVAAFFAEKLLKRGHTEAVYHGISVSNLIKLKEAIIKIKGVVPMIKAPILIMHSLYDDIVQPRSAQYIYKKIGSKRKKLVWLKGRRHGIDDVEDAELIVKEVCEFVNADEPID